MLISGVANFQNQTSRMTFNFNNFGSNKAFREFELVFIGAFGSKLEQCKKSFIVFLFNVFDDSFLISLTNVSQYTKKRYIQNVFLVDMDVL